MKSVNSVRVFTAAVVLALFSAYSGAMAFSAAEQRGHALLEKMCARCHAIDRTGTSPHVGAPPFRELDRRLDLDTFFARLSDGLTSGHPDMPTFRFSRGDAKAAVAYLRTIQRH